MTATSKKMENVFQRSLGVLKRLWKDDESRFRFATTLKLLSIPSLTLILLMSYLWTFLRMDLGFFEANGYPGIIEFRRIFYDYLIGEITYIVPFIGGFMVLLTFLGMYIADLLMRPFKIIGDYCEKVINDQNASYDPDFFTDLRLLTSFSEYFFNYMSNARKNKLMQPQEIPRKYTGIHQPVFEKSFFLQYSVFLLGTFIVVSSGLYRLCTDLHDGLIRLALETLEHNQSVELFLNDQIEVLSGILFAVVFAHIIFYFILALHLYGRVSGPAFGIFATMRSFIKGNYNARVHLIGYYYLRGECRKINRFLDLMQRELGRGN